jgi:hypothetical protein
MGSSDGSGERVQSEASPGTGGLGRVSAGSNRRISEISIDGAPARAPGMRAPTSVARWDWPYMKWGVVV